MGKSHGVDSLGNPIDLIGQPMATPLDEDPLEFVPMKADKTGIYEVGKYRFHANAGDVIHDDAKYVGERKKANPENRARKAAPQNRSAKVADAKKGE